MLPPLMEEELPYSARLRVKRPFTEVRTSEPSASLSVDGQTIELTTDRCHTVLEIELSSYSGTSSPIWRCPIFVGHVSNVPCGTIESCPTLAAAVRPH
ncbi:MAG: hypothetical protein ABIK89_03800 [Planctomycetota bacterium]